LGIGRPGLLALPREHAAPVAAVCGFGIGRPGLLAFPREGRKRRPWRQCAAWASAGQGCSLSLKSMRAAVAAVCGFARRYVAQLLPVVLVCAGSPPDVGVTAGVGKRAGMYAPPGGSSVVVAASAGRCSLAQSKRRSRRQDAAASSRTVCCPVSVHVGRARRPEAAALLGGIGWSGKSPLSARGQSSRSSVADAKASARRGGGLASSGRGWLGRGAVRRIGR
jgi:hypothetical protein